VILVAASSFALVIWMVIDGGFEISKNSPSINSLRFCVLARIRKSLNESRTKCPKALDTFSTIQLRTNNVCAVDLLMHPIAAIFDEELDRFSAPLKHPSQSSYVFLQNTEKIIELLSHTGDMLAREAIDRLGEKKKKLMQTTYPSTFRVFALKEIMK
jgi:hypothetical protein